MVRNANKERIFRPWEEVREQSTPEELANSEMIFKEQYCGRGRKPAFVPIPEQVGGSTLHGGAVAWLQFNFS